MLQIKTIIKHLPDDIDEAVNTALADDWELVRRECFVTGSDRALTFYAELSKFVLPDAVEPELDEYDDRAHWQVHRDPMLPFHCSKCGFKSTKPYAVCPGCETLMDAECEEMK